MKMKNNEINTRNVTSDSQNTRPADKSIKPIITLFTSENLKVHICITRRFIHPSIYMGILKFKEYCSYRAKIQDQKIKQ